VRGGGASPSLIAVRHLWPVLRITEPSSAFSVMSSRGLPIAAVPSLPAPCIPISLSSGRRSAATALATADRATTRWPSRSWPSITDTFMKNADCADHHYRHTYTRRHDLATRGDETHSIVQAAKCRSRRYTDGSDPYDRKPTSGDCARQMTKRNSEKAIHRSEPDREQCILMPSRNGMNSISAMARRPNVTREGPGIERS